MPLVKYDLSLDINILINMIATAEDSIKLLDVQNQQIIILFKFK